MYSSPYTSPQPPSGYYHGYANSPSPSPSRGHPGFYPPPSLRTYSRHASTDTYIYSPRTIGTILYTSPRYSSTGHYSTQAVEYSSLLNKTEYAYPIAFDKKGNLINIAEHPNSRATRYEESPSRPHSRRTSESTPKRSSTANRHSTPRPTSSHKKSAYTPPPKATDADARKHKIPAGYSLKDMRFKKSTQHERRIQVRLDNREYAALGDTAAGQNIISEHLRQELGLKLHPNPKWFPLGNSKKAFSPGTVQFQLTFQHGPAHHRSITAHVLHNSAHDLILGLQVLQDTESLTKYKHRFVLVQPYESSLKSEWSFNLLGDTSQRFKTQLGKGPSILSLLDTGCTRNVMNAEWALENSQKYGLEMFFDSEDCGSIRFADGTGANTIGKARTTMIMPDGKYHPIIFELLPNCQQPVVLGEDIFHDLDIYNSYASSLINLDDPDSGDELMSMSYSGNLIENHNPFRRRQRHSSSNANNEDDLDRQVQWNMRYGHGMEAPVDEWNCEDARRENFRRSQNPQWQRDPHTPLIKYQPQAGQAQNAPGSAQHAGRDTLQPPPAPNNYTAGSNYHGLSPSQDGGGDLSAAHSTISSGTSSNTNSGMNDQYTGDACGAFEDTQRAGERSA